MRAIIIDDDKDREYLNVIRSSLKRLNVELAHDGDFLGAMGVGTFKKKLHAVSAPPDLAIVDYKLGWKDIQGVEWTGREVAAHIRSHWPGQNIHVIFVSAFLRSTKTPYETLRALVLPPGTEFIEFTGDWVAEFEAKVRFVYPQIGFDSPPYLRDQDRPLAEEFVRKAVDANVPIMGESPPFLDALLAAAKAARQNIPVMLVGAPGTGRRTMARAIHANSAVSSENFHYFNCAEMSPDEEAGIMDALTVPGTVYFHNFDKMPRSLQLQLARALPEGRTAAGNQAKRLLARIVSSSTMPENSIALTGFSETVLSRLKRYPIEVPSLAERGEDISELARHFLSRTASDLEFSPKALRKLKSAVWPDNLAGLVRAVEIAAIRAHPQKVIQEEHLPSTQTDILAAWDHGSWAEVKHKAVLARMAQALNNNGGNVQKAADEIQMSRAHFSKTAKAWGLTKNKSAKAKRQEDIDAIRNALAATGWRTAEAAAKLGMPPATLESKVKRYKIKQSPEGDEATDSEAI